MTSATENDKMKERIRELEALVKDIWDAFEWDVKPSGWHDDLAERMKKLGI